MVLERVDHLLDVLMIQLDVLVRDVSFALLYNFGVVSDGLLERLRVLTRRFVLFFHLMELLIFRVDLLVEICLKGFVRMT